ncbi:leucine zipper putative tumor suppressor 2-like [Phyllostomus hastatus]|uniref:leucine zipper putative tumor suppressor 2-like n=1 Tax=Phyllostomus hastatus TaxID=9423 RepID=UPI001E681786|nr:leucine zipper putative tumor suppressor 2-like [Phyllostomus hastatus]
MVREMQGCWLEPRATNEGRQPQPLEAGKGKEMDSLLQSPERNAALLTPRFHHGRPPPSLPGRPTPIAVQTPGAPADWACSGGAGQPVGSGRRGPPRPHLGRARPPAHRPGGHLAGAAASRGRSPGRRRAALGVREPQPNFFLRSPTFRGRSTKRGGESRVPGSSSSSSSSSPTTWPPPPPLPLAPKAPLLLRRVTTDPTIHEVLESMKIQRRLQA